ncbi:peptidoglycan DD-metalloendopeptidase family protein [Hymenobacter sp. RP-2-7]|uniref:Peptidoglycan DD-metalloendopeptidase family protein n=1 Tax=Hymenobacter polaris TaxID=2682546 RepID=A0A7Y0AFU5_9BACT|nr:peptidoglycan DD-metalloendopeptidase family protein [Hymenobacter polaris]NML66547.1 peptidoglycan DD-metalloendopeptidase family protein [Hymenobacter polaris]
MPEFSTLLARHRHRLAPLFPFPLRGPGVARLDFTAANPRLAQPEQLRDTAAFTRVVQAMLAEQQATVGVGGYLENRVIYRRSPHFDAATEARSLHLGLDVWVPAGTPVAAPLPAIVHSLADNNHFGDYGPTVILEHPLDGETFYTLYGHLTRTDLAALRPGQGILKGQAFAHVGPYPENGDWPPHLHFQVITDLQGRWGDFPGVAPPSEQAYWAALCPSPWLLVN